MRHLKRGRKLGRNSGHRKALRQNILKSLFQHGQIITTITKAKEYAASADKLITIAKKAEARANALEKEIKENARGDVSPELEEEIARKCAAIRLAHFRRAFAILRDQKLCQKLFHVIAPLYEERSGGYTRVLRLGSVRLGDSATQAVLQLVEDIPEEEDREKSREEKKAEKEKTKQKKAEKKKKEKDRKDKEKEKEKQRREKEKQRVEKEKELKKRDAQKKKDKKEKKKKK